MKKIKHHSLSINTILTTAFSFIITVIVVLIGTIVILVMENSIISTTKDTSEQLVSQAQFTLNKYFLTINNSLQNLAQNDALVEMCKYSTEKNNTNNLENREIIQKQILGLLRNQTDLTNILVIGDEFSIFHSDIANVPLMKSPLIQELLAQKETQQYAKITYHPISSPTYYTYTSKELEIPISLMVRDLSTYDTTNYGVVLASLRLQTLNDFFTQMDSDSGFTAFLVEEGGSIFYSTKNEWIGKDYSQYLKSCGVTENDGTFLYDSSHRKVLLENSRNLGLNDWDIVLTSEMSPLNNRVHTLRHIIFICTAISLVLILSLSYILTRRITAPLARLSVHMEKMDYNSLSQKLSSRFSYKEVKLLYSGYNQMIERIETLINEVYYEQLRQKDAQYEALQARINPHFLYNTLQSISSLAVLERNDDIELVTNSLGGMLEYLTYEKNSQVTLAKEIDYIKKYVQIQLLRYNHCFDVEYEIVPATLSLRISKLLLQPMVENAIQHGLKQKDLGGRLYLRTALKEDLLIVEIEDNGAGMEKDALERLIQRTNNPDKDSFQKSIGLSNVQERIHLKYGSQYGITITSAPGQGTTVKVTIPTVLSNQEEI